MRRESLHDLRVERDAGRMPGSKKWTVIAGTLAIVGTLGGGCKSAAAPMPSSSGGDPSGHGQKDPSISKPAPGPEQDRELGPAAKQVDAKDLAGDFACGPWNTKDLEKTEVPLIGDHVRVRFFAGATPVGGTESGKVEIEKDGHTLFYGARETYQRGDDLFERKAAKAALFGGDSYEALTIPAAQGKIPIVTGVRKQVADAKGDMVAIAHGWFLDPNRDVVDVAIFVSKGAVTDVERCRLFAEKLVSTATLGPRRIVYGKGAGSDVDSQVSYAKFSYKLSEGWVLTSSAGIHDFSRLHFRKRGAFPRGFTELEMALDSHPGNWKSEGEPDGDKSGNLLGLAVSWHLTKDSSGSFPLYGGWTKSETTVRNDHAVASINASSAEERDDAIKFAESVKAGR